jgi:hypothetical protein
MIGQEKRIADEGEATEERNRLLVFNDQCPACKPDAGSRFDAQRRRVESAGDCGDRNERDNPERETVTA